MNFIKTKEIIANYQSVDYTNTLKLSSLLNEMSDIATTHALDLKMWDPERIDEYGWIVSKIHLHLDTPINFDYKIKTMIGTHSKVIFPRYFEFYNQDQVIGYASTIWTLLDLQKRRIIKPEKAGLVIPDNPELVPPCDLPQAIEDVEYEFVEERKVRYSDIDTNQHMNNTKYIDWACDLLDIEFFKSNFITDLDVYYMHEIAPNQIVSLYKYQDDTSIYIKGSVDNKDCFKLKLQYQQY